MELEPERQVASSGDDLDALRDALETERARVAELYEHAPVGYLVTSPEGVIREANVAAAELLGIARRFLRGKPIYAYVASSRELRLRVARLEPDQTDRFELALLPRGLEPLRADVVVRRTGEAVRWTLLDLAERDAALRDAAAARMELELRVEQRTAELEHERAQLDSVIAQLPVGILIADAETRRLVGSNQLAADLIGLELSAGAPVSELERARLRTRDGHDVPLDELPLLRALRDGTAVDAELFVHERAGSPPRLLEVSASPVRGADGRVSAAVCLLHDVTERERRELAEREFVTNAAHELQTPLAAIASAVEVLQAGAKDDPEDRERFLAHVQTETQRLTRLAHGLLVLARAQTGVERPATETFRLRPLLDEIALTLHPARGVQIRVRCPARLTATTNRELLEQAVLTLAANAAKYTIAGEIRLTASGQDSGTVIEVADTGPGVPSGEERTVFDRFYRVGRRGRDGFGLGLAIASQAAEAIGATIELRPRRGGGTSAVFTVPAPGP